MEINNPFYQLLSEKSILRWVESVPTGFIFSSKANRTITQMKYLLELEETLPKFFNQLALFNGKTGPLLFQLPPHWEKNTERLEHFIPTLPADGRYAFELRNLSWLDEEIYAILREHGIAFCIYEINFRRSPILATTDFVYIRCMGWAELSMTRILCLPSSAGHNASSMM